MGKLVEKPRNLRGPNAKHEVHRLRDERRKLSWRLAKLDERLAKLAPAPKDEKAPNPATLNRWLDELSKGLDHLPLLPSNFSRADLYNDHD
jgi:hypothetical protein